MKNRFTKVKGISERRRLPRLGIIRLGLKVKRGEKEFPTETDYFVLNDAPGVEKVYGAQPKELEVVFPLNDPEIIFPQSLRLYGRRSGLKCQGDGEKAVAYDEDTKKFVDRVCPCEHYGKDCNVHGNLMFFLPKVSWGGIFQIRTSSFNSIKDINSALEMYMGMLGRISMVPFYLCRRPINITKDGRSRIHHTMTLEFRGKTEDVIRIQSTNTAYLQMGNQYLLEAPDETNPELTKPDVESGPAEDAYYEESDTSGTAAVVDTKTEDPAPMEKEQINKLRGLMKQSGLDNLDDQNTFFIWHLKQSKAEKTKSFADKFISEFDEIFKAYMIKDAPPEDGAPSFFD